ncbi:Subtilisin-like serine protease [Winogradskyella psychrotolerans RS-3]|uniref:Subtilisin-like serine protease n=1 Tax=Winogradskyella psychrotolerans RS-3 TaxID=641526 RepID=S7WZ80_9FLAO|nr:S8 family serine peptidase [Winogradskyella psychrotolerans]EPR72084.1 Subtilisin-like serine protease [Winogradskyella psychrotolerans RS-3]
MKNIFTVLLLIFITKSFAQEDAWIYLTDKPNVSTVLANPTSILTQKAIDRKQRHNITIDERDVPVNEIYISDLKAQTGITVLAKSKWFNAAHVRGTEDNIKALSNLTFVETIDFANQNLNTASRRASRLNKTEIEDETIAFTYGDTQNQVEMINADNLHLADYTGEGITIAVMDSGFPNVNTMGAFQRLRENNDLLDGYDFVDRTSDVYAFTGSNHGTKVLSTMAAFVQDQFVGTAPDASYYLFRTEDSGSENPVEESYWVEAAERADSLGVDLINTSLGYTTYDNSNYSYSPADMNGQTAYISKGASIAAEKGILVVVSAGNAGATDWQTVGAPGDSPDVLSIGGVDGNGDYVSFSSQGGIAQIGYQKPDVVARGGAAYVVSEFNSIVQNNGTSFSSPILCGGIASLWQALPNASPTEIKDYVRQSASQFNTPDDFLGYGIPDLDLAKNLALSLDEEQLGDFIFYPNPVKSNLNIVLPSTVNQLEVSVYNQLGQEILNQVITENSKTINVSSFTAGIYLIRFSTQNISKTLKFIKSSNE